MELTQPWSGPKIDPWGTPVVIAISYDLKSPTDSCCLPLIGIFFIDQLNHHLHHNSNDLYKSML